MYYKPSVKLGKSHFQRCGLDSMGLNLSVISKILSKLLLQQLRIYRENPRCRERHLLKDLKHLFYTWSKGNTIYVNGKPLAEKWTHTEPLGPPIGVVHLKANQFFMMGDNHSDSCDSRSWGPITRSDIIGKAFLRIWPLRRFGSL